MQNPVTNVLLQVSAPALSDEFRCVVHVETMYLPFNGTYRVSQKSSPPKTFNDIFAWAESFCIQFCTFISNIHVHPRMSTDFRLLILTFNEMALILLRAPIIFTGSSFDHWLKTNCSDFIAKDEWPTNSPDLNPMDYHV